VPITINPCQLGLQDPTLFIQKAWINNEWILPQGRGTFRVTSEYNPNSFFTTAANEINTDPATGEVLGSVPEMTAADTTEAITRASEAFETFSKTTPQVCTIPR
jgi:succinate-semialdehyde dehydrogenase / glutarate-semialdehyde dehydrogenase